MRAIYSNKLILGSQSPRRKALLEKAGFVFGVTKIEAEESFPESLEVGAVAEFIAKRKNEAYKSPEKDEIIITADTVVVRQNKILGKPSDPEEASLILRQLSGRIHQVITGICIRKGSESTSFSSLTDVKVKQLATKEIAYYVHRFDPLDKAGAYGIQEWLGLIAVEWIKGSFYNVMGLPVDKVYKSLTENFNCYPVLE